MEDILSPTHAFLDFDFSDFIDKNFDVSNGIFNSPNTKSSSPSVLSSSSNSLNDFLSQSGDSKTAAAIETYTHETQSLSYLDHPLWSSIEELAFETSNLNSKLDTKPPSFSCIDEFIKDPQSDLVELVQQCESERALFQNLINSSINQHVSITPDQQFQQQKQHYFQQQFKQTEKCRPPCPDQFHLNYIAHPQPISNHQKKRKNNTQPQAQSQTSKRSAKVSGYSSSNNSNYTHSDSVNAQLLRELIRQAGRNNRNATRMNASVDMNSNSLVLPFANNDFRTVPSKDPYYDTPIANGNYHVQPYQGYYTNTSDLIVPPLPPSSLSPAASHSSHHHVSLPYHIPNSNKKHGMAKQSKSTNYPYQRPSSSKSFTMGKPSMYSSDISQAQLLEIQAISRAQQDFIRAREQQEAEKEMMIKHQKKVHLQ